MKSKPKPPRNSRVTIKLPRGWRWLRKGEILREGDYWVHFNRGSTGYLRVKWLHITLVNIPANNRHAYIRRTDHGR